MMQQSNGSDNRYLPPAPGMDYAAMEAVHHHPGVAHHPAHPGLVDPHLHYGLGAPHPHHHQGLHQQPPLTPLPGAGGVKRSADSAGLDMMAGSDSDEDSMVDVKPNITDRGRGSSKGSGNESTATSKKTRGRVKIKMEFIDNKLRRYTTFSKRKTGIMKKAYELSTLTGTQVMLLVASETGHVYTFATRKLQPMITSDAGKALIQTCLNSPDPPSATSNNSGDQRMSATGYEETELTYNVPEDIAAAEQQQKVRQMMYAANSHYSSLFPSPGANNGSPSQPSPGLGQPPTANMQHHPSASPYSHPAPSPSPSAMHPSSYGVTSLSPTTTSGMAHSPGPAHHLATSHSPPFVLPHQHQSVAGR